jgi:hypothetical protein
MFAHMIQIILIQRTLSQDAFNQVSILSSPVLLQIKILSNVCHALPAILLSTEFVKLFPALLDSTCIMEFAIHFQLVALITPLLTNAQIVKLDIK